LEGGEHTKDMLETMASKVGLTTKEVTTMTVEDQFFLFLSYLFDFHEVLTIFMELYCLLCVFGIIRFAMQLVAL